MALHSPVHHAGMAGSHLYRNFLLAMVLAVIAVALIAVAASTVRFTFTPGITTAGEAQALIEYRAAERADWVAGMTTEGGSLVEFRAAERASR